MEEHNNALFRFMIYAKYPQASLVFGSLSVLGGGGGG